MAIRKITSLTAGLAFILVVMTSLILYIVPQGRVAYWADWRLWGLSKEQWGNVHMVNGLLFLLSLFLHIYYNWKPIVSYMKNKAKALKIFTKEFNVALGLTVVFSVGTLIEVPPFQWVLDFNGYLKDEAAVKYGEPPYGHAELSTFKTFARKQGFDLKESMARLEESGIRFNNEKQTLKDIARVNHVSPQQVYLAMKPAKRSISANADKPVQKGEKAGGTGSPMGLGKMTLAQVVEKYNLNQSFAVKKLAENGISAKPDDKIRKIAEKHQTTPYDLFEMIK